MGKRLVLVHGRSTKPAKAQYARLQKEALVQGMARIDPAKAEALRSGAVPIDFVYFGDITNRILAESDPEARAELTERDPHSGGAPCLPVGTLHEAIDRLGRIGRFDKRAYRKVLRENKDLRFVDDIVRAVSTLASLATATLANELVIRTATSDMGAYLMRRKIGSDVRERLQAPLRRAIRRGDDICLVSHSMGCLVAYDVLWKFSHLSEYAHVREAENPIRCWLTLGCPLGEAGVKANLYDAGERGEDRYPKRIVEHWTNVAAMDDFISHDASMRDDYRAMLKRGYVQSIKDFRIYNCFTDEGRSNPHKLYGYLANPAAIRPIADWMG
ncbi:MAG: hypothetical protein HKN63_01920 [Rhodobacteraceae bacterium]|nr:hypothetical protein [Paracoccaceae bacterium]